MNSSWLERTKNTKLDLWDSWNRELGDRKCSRGPGGLTHGELVFDGLCASVRLMASSDNNAEGYITLQMYSIPPNQHLEMVKTVLAVVAYNFNFRAQVDLLVHGQLHSVTLSPKKKSLPKNTWGRKVLECSSMNRVPSMHKAQNSIASII